VARKRHTAEEIVAKPRQVDVLIAQGRQVADAVRVIGVTEVTYYRWRNEYGGLKGDQVKRLKELETENSRLRRAVSDLTLDKVGARVFSLLTPLKRLLSVLHREARFRSARNLSGTFIAVCSSSSPTTPCEAFCREVVR
jgi:putative transposase